MDHAFWQSRWSEGRIGFHEGTPNQFLARHGNWLAGCRRILVPLCGKTEDLAYLAGRGHEVVGVELVENAVRQFFAEHGATPAVTTRDGFSVYSAGAITVLAGDFFATTAALVGTVDGIYDRAALIALPPDLRTRYIAHLRTLAPAARRELLVALDDPDGSADGPPFSVPEAEVRAHFTGRDVTLVEQAPDPRGRAGGKMVERCYTITLEK
jgi:thiopurine S-methyltransferase